MTNGSLTAYVESLVTGRDAKGSIYGGRMQGRMSFLIFILVAGNGTFPRYELCSCCWMDGHLSGGGAAVNIFGLLTELHLWVHNFIMQTVLPVSRKTCFTPLL